MTKIQNRNRNRRNGLSLLEVIIATVILAVSSVMLVKIIGNGDRNARKAEKRVTAQMICQNRLDEILSGILPLEASDPTQDLYFPDWHYAVNVEDYADDFEATTSETDTNLLLVEVQVFYLPVDESADTNTFQNQFESPVYALKRIVRMQDETVEDAAFRNGGVLNETQ